MRLRRQEADELGALLPFLLPIYINIREYNRFSAEMLSSSPLRYPGGKGKLCGFFTELTNVNGLHGGTYIEPFAGGAAVAINLLLSGVMNKIVLNDLDKSIWAFWKAMLTNTDEFVKETTRAPLTVTEWKRQKIIQKDPDATMFDLGFSTFYLNRTNRSGVLNGGIIGGIDQNGTYRIDARFNRELLIERIRTISEMKRQIEIYNLDAEDFLQCQVPKYPKNSTLIYLDPPYFVKGRALYMSYYDEEDHQNLSKAIRSLDRHWCLSYDDVPQIQVFYQGHLMRRYKLDYCVNSVKKGLEIMVFSNELKIPKGLKLPSQLEH